MRAAVVPLLCVLLAPLAAAFELTDPTGDPTVEPAGAPAIMPSGADLRKLVMTEGENGFTFQLDAGELENPTETPFHTAEYRIKFIFNGADYQIVWYRFATLEPALEPSLTATLRDGQDQVLASLPYDAPLTVFVQRGLIVDSTGNIPAAGARLDDLHVESAAKPSDTFAPDTIPGTITDRMPDDGGQDYPIQFGPATIGNMRASAQQAFRTSNGGAEAFLYLINVTGGGANARIGVESAPSGWTVYTPSGGFNAANAVVPILVETAFFHQHGAIGAARLSITDGTNVARVDLGINYLEPARPDGHHSTLVFHAARTTKDAVNDAAETATGANFARAIWFNTASEDASDEGVPVAGFEATREGVSGYAWVATLNPLLRDGIQFAEGTGIIRVPISFPADTEARLHGTLTWTMDGGEPLIVGNITPMEPVHLAADQVATVEGILTTQESRFDLGAASGRLRLDVLLESDQILQPYGPKSHPFWEPGGTIQIPLYDYHAPVQDQLAEVTGLNLKAPAEVQLMPGTTGVFAPELTSGASYTLDVFGALGEWAKADGKNLVITVPSDARIGDFGEIVIRAIQDDDPLLWAIARTRIVVAETNSLPPPEPIAKESPLASGATIVLAMLAIACARKSLQRGGQT